MCAITVSHIYVVHVYVYMYVRLYMYVYMCVCIYVYVYMFVYVCAFYTALRSQRCSGLPKYLTFLPRPRNKHCFKKPMEQLLASFEMS